VGGFNSNLNLTLSGLPAGVTISTSQGTGGSALNVSFIASTKAAVQSSTLTLTATGGGVTKSTTLVLNVTAH
jgi:hypothetical protein